MKKIFVLVFVLIMTFSFVACSDNSANQVVEEEARQDEQVVNTPEAPIEAPAVEEPEVEQSMVDVFIERYNATAPTVITDAVEVDVTDEESGHYRTEFRLGAFEGSIAKTGRIGDIVIDIVNCGWDNDELRIYADGITQEQAVEIVKYAAPIMDSEVSDADLQDVLDYLSGTSDYHNGYFGNLCMTFNEIHGQLMLRTD
ncbi:MAG: hypothetical protein E6933_11160 [Clostridiales bacterium]|nr:hypothetical protein [Clostridiales bacterium]